MDISGELIIGILSIFYTGIGVVLAYVFKSNVMKCRYVIVSNANEMIVERMNLIN
jgi:hypothetical protein